ncbi:SH3 domain-containing protein [Arenimonas sp.]|uniref:SH3 domain-containing protein n=1 Tax=Arenimonas sp. TaxID=1872635 RepID=UPI0035B21296
MITRRRYPIPTLALALAATLASGLAFAESATTLRATEMRSEPLGSAEVVAKLGAKAPVDITGRKGAWAGIKNAEGLDGWVRVLNLRTGTSDGKSAGGGNQLAAAFLTGSSGNTVSTGVKGLSPEKLRNAGSAPSEVEMLDGLAVQPDDARRFAGAASLEAHQVDYLKSDRRSRRKQR